LLSLCSDDAEDVDNVEDDRDKERPPMRCLRILFGPPEGDADNVRELEEVNPGPSLPEDSVTLAKEEAAPSAPSLSAVIVIVVAVVGVGVGAVGSLNRTIVDFEGESGARSMAREEFVGGESVL